MIAEQQEFNFTTFVIDETFSKRLFSRSRADKRQFYFSFLNLRGNQTLPRHYILQIPLALHNDPSSARSPSGLSTSLSLMQFLSERREIVVRGSKNKITTLRPLQWQGHRGNSTARSSFEANQPGSTLCSTTER